MRTTIQKREKEFYWLLRCEETNYLGFFYGTCFEADAFRAQKAREYAAVIDEDRFYIDVADVREADAAKLLGIPLCCVEDLVIPVSYGDIMEFLCHDN